MNDPQRLQKLMDRHDGKNHKCDVCFLINLARDQTVVILGQQAAYQRLLETPVRIVKEKASAPKSGGIRGASIVHPLIRTLTEPGPLVTGRSRRA